MKINLGHVAEKVKKKFGLLQKIQDHDDEFDFMGANAETKGIIRYSIKQQQRSFLFLLALY